MRIIDTKKVVYNKLDEYQKITKTIPVLMGDANGVVSVVGQTGYVYVRDMTGNTLMVWNSIAPLVAGLAVMVGSINGRLQVTQVRDIYYNSLMSNTAPHGYTHSYGSEGADVINIYPEQYMPWYAYTSADDNFTVSILRQVMSAGGVWIINDVEDIDLNAHIPVTATQALYVLISLDEDGALVHTVGTPVVNKAALVITDIPAIPTGNIPLWAVILYVGQTAITRDMSDSDYVDLRFAQTGGGGSSSSVPEGTHLQIGGTDAYPTTSEIRFGDDQYVRLRESSDDQFAITMSGEDCLIMSYDVQRIGNITNGRYMQVNSTGFSFVGKPVFLPTIKSGATQVAAGAAANEIWKTSGHESLPDNVLMIGV